jgi:hypothetical protein
MLETYFFRNLHSDETPFKFTTLKIPDRLWIIIVPPTNEILEVHKKTNFLSHHITHTKNSQMQ